MSTPRKNLPSYRLHKSSGQAVVTLAGRMHYLGSYGSPESKREYDRLIAHYLANNRHLPPEPAPDLTVLEVLDAYWSFARDYYGTRTSQAGHVAKAVRIAGQLYGDVPVIRFGPAAYKACRQQFVEAGWCRRHVNQVAGCLKRAFKWAAGEELIPASIWHALQAVEGLRRGRTPARESDEVQPAPEASIAAVRGLVLPQVRAAIDLQLLTAARPGEVLALRPMDVDRSGTVWVYRPPSHKTAHRGQRRTILIGPRAQLVLTSYLDRDPASYCLSPREAMETLRREQGQNAHFGRERTPGERYTTQSYGRAVATACKRAGVEAFGVHRLRHSAGTRIVQEFGWELGRLILGHRHLDTTRIYAADDLQKAMEVMGKVG